MGMIEKFQEDLRNGMTLEDALTKHNLTFKEAVEFVHKPITKKAKNRRPYKKKNYYQSVDEHISHKAGAFHVRKSINGEMKWGGSYNTLEDAQTVRDFLNKEGWNIVKVNEVCKKFGIERRRR